MEAGFPWYDSSWLHEYRRVQAWIKAHHPEKLQEFEARLRPLHTRSDFEIAHLREVFDPDTVEQIRKTALNVDLGDVSLDKNFGRLILHNVPFFLELQECLVDRVSSIVGEDVEVSYNFLSLYTALGSCDIHMDAPSAKWTLDFCIDQSVEWPIYFSEIVPWPETSTDTSNEWRACIRTAHRFSCHILKPNEAIVFSGSSQWHYRDPIPRSSEKEFCNLLFFHFVPRNMRSVVQLRDWPELFDLPDMAELGLRSDLGLFE